MNSYMSSAQNSTCHIIITAIAALIITVLNQVSDTACGKNELESVVP